MLRYYGIEFGHNAVMTFFFMFLISFSFFFSLSLFLFESVTKTAKSNNCNNKNGRSVDTLFKIKKKKFGIAFPCVTLTRCSRISLGVHKVFGMVGISVPRIEP